MSWLEDRAKRDKAVRDGLQDVWLDLREAVKSAHQAFVANYTFDRNTFSVNVSLVTPEGQMSIIIEDNAQELRSRIDILLEETQVVARTNAPKTEVVYTIGATDDGTLALFNHGRCFTVDAVSQIILEPFFFGGSQKPRLYPKR
jgi:hypothetical protein